MLFSVAINGMNDGIECYLIKFAHDTEHRVASDTLESHAAIQKDLVRLDK